MKSNERRTIGGVELEAVRFQVPCPHWRVKVVATGYLFDSGVFRGCEPLRIVWETAETFARLCPDSWALETYGAELESAELFRLKKAGTTPEQMLEIVKARRGAA